MNFTGKRKNHLFICAALFVLYLSGAPVLPAQEAHGCLEKIVEWNALPVRQKNAYRFEIDPKFDAARRKLIREALDLAVRRMQEKSVWQEVSRGAGFAFPTRKTVNNSGFCNDSQIRRNLLFHQLFYISVPDGNDESATKFPDTEIVFGNEAPAPGKRGWLGKAFYDLVSIYWSNARNRWQKSGSFKISINAHFLFKTETLSHPEYWAGIIAHEMLHNLGHKHPKSTHPDYNRYQVNVLAVAVQNYGQPSAGPALKGRFPVYACADGF